MADMKRLVLTFECPATDSQPLGFKGFASVATQKFLTIEPYVITLCSLVTN